LRNFGPAARSLRYGNTRENVLSIDAILADGSSGHFGPAARDLSDLPANSPVGKDLEADFAAPQTIPEGAPYPIAEDWTRLASRAAICSAM